MHISVVTRHRQILQLYKTKCIEYKHTRFITSPLLIFYANFTIKPGISPKYPTNVNIHSIPLNANMLTTAHTTKPIAHHARVLRRRKRYSYLFSVKLVFLQMFRSIFIEASLRIKSKYYPFCNVGCMVSYSLKILGNHKQVGSLFTIS